MWYVFWLLGSLLWFMMGVVYVVIDLVIGDCLVLILICVGKIVFVGDFIMVV